MHTFAHTYVCMYVYKHFDLIAWFTHAINNHFNVYFHTHLLNEIKRRHFMWTNSLSSSLLLSCKKKCWKEQTTNAANFFYGFTSVFSCCCCCFLLSSVIVVAHRLRRSSITGKSNKLNYFNFFALLLLSLSPIRAQTQMLPLSLYRVLPIVPPCFPYSLL